MQSKQRAILIGYATVALSAVAYMVLTRIYLLKLGMDEYGLYQYIYSIAEYALMLDMGIASVVVRSLTESRLAGKRADEENRAVHCLLITVFCVMVIWIIGIVVRTVFLDTLMASRPARQRGEARVLLTCMLVQISLVLLQHYFDGVIISHERFTVSKATKLVHIPLKTCLILLLLFSDIGVISIALGDVAATFLLVLFTAYYSFAKLGLRLKWSHFDRGFLKNAGKLMFALLLQSVSIYANHSLGKTVIGYQLNNTAVTIYAIALSIADKFDQIPAVIGSVFLPQAVKNVKDGKDAEALTDMVIRPGRIQFMLCSGVFFGFLLFGRQFISLWVGPESLLAWTIAVLIMAATILPLTQNVCLTILTAKNKRGFCSYVLLITAALNLCMMIPLVRWIGILGAAISTAFTLFLGNFVIMNIYYRRVIGLNVVRMFRDIMKGTLPCVLIAGAVTAPLLFLSLQGWTGLLIKLAAFIAAYGCLLLRFGMNSNEREALKALMHRRKILRRKA